MGIEWYLLINLICSPIQYIFWRERERVVPRAEPWGGTSLVGCDGLGRWRPRLGRVGPGPTVAPTRPWRGKPPWLGPLVIELPCPFCLVIEKRDMKKEDRR